MTNKGGCIMVDNASLGIGLVTITWNDQGHSMGRRVEVSTKDVTSHVITLKRNESTNIKVDGIDYQTYVDMKKGNPK